MSGVRAVMFLHKLVKLLLHVGDEVPVDDLMRDRTSARIDGS
jgi:hypothetical protein